MRTKREVPVLVAFLAVLVIIVGLYAADQAINASQLHPSSAITSLINWISQRGVSNEVSISGPADFQKEMSQAMKLLKEEAPQAWEAYVKPTLREIQYTSVNQTPFDSAGVINMGWWDTTELEGGVPLKSRNSFFAYTLGQYQNPNDPGYAVANTTIPAKVYNDPRWIASIIAGFTVESAHGGPTQEAACAQRKVLQEMGVYLQYTFPDACGK